MENTPPKRASDKAAPFVPYDEWLQDLEAVGDAQASVFIRNTLRGKEHLHIFGRYFFPHLIQGTDDVPECHLDLLRELSAPKDSGIIFPRGYAKSTWEKIDTIHDFVYGLEDVILYVGDTVTDAGLHFEGIKAELEGNDLLTYVYGSLVPAESARGRKWTNRHIEASNGVAAVARGRGKGRGVNIKGRRPTKIVIDDAENDESVKKEAQRQKFHHWLYNVIFLSMNQQRGKIKMIGTAIHELAEVVQFHKKHGGIFRRAIEDGESIWPAQYSLSDLEAIKSGGVLRSGKEVKGIGTRAFNRELMNNPTSAEEAALKEEWITQAHFTELPPEFSYEAVGHIDPQSGEKATADEYAITVLMSARRTPHRYVYSQRAGHGSQLDQAKECVRAWIPHKRIMRAFGVEKVLNQTSTWSILRDWKARRIDFNTVEMVAEHRRTGKKPEGWVDEDDRNMPIVAVSPRGKDKKARLEMFEPDFERGEVHLRPEQEELAHQLMFNVGKGGDDHDDRADSLVGALELAGRSSSRPKTDDEAKALRESKEKRYTGTIAGNLMKRNF